MGVTIVSDVIVSQFSEKLHFVSLFNYFQVGFYKSSCKQNLNKRLTWILCNQFVDRSPKVPNRNDGICFTAGPRRHWKTVWHWLRDEGESLFTSLYSIKLGFPHFLIQTQNEYCLASFKTVLKHKECPIPRFKTFTKTCSKFQSN